MGRITLEQVTKSFGDVKVIPPLDLEIDDGEFVVFVGPSGCGKSTLLRLIAGLEDVTSGRDRDRRQWMPLALPPAKRGLAMVFQSYALYPHMSVRKNIAFPHEAWPKIDQAEIDRRVGEAAKVLNLSDYHRSAARAALGRPAPAGRHRSRHCARAGGVPVRRAPFQPRRGTARRHAVGDLRAAQPAQDHDGLRHPRPGRGDDHGRQDRRAPCRGDRTGGQPSGALPQPAQHIRGWLHRQPRR